MATIYFQSQSNARLALATQYYKTQANPTCRYVSYHQTQALCSDTGLLFFKTHANPGGFSQPVYYVTHASAPSQAQQTLWNGLISGTSLPEWEGVFKIGETEAPCYIDFKVNWNLSSPSTASMSFNDPYCRYMPEFPGAFHEKMNEYALNASYSPNNPQLLRPKRVNHLLWHLQYKPAQPGRCKSRKSHGTSQKHGVLLRAPVSRRYQRPDRS